MFLSSNLLIKLMCFQFSFSINCFNIEIDVKIISNKAKIMQVGILRILVNHIK
jgi:hypothetical protein